MYETVVTVGAVFAAPTFDVAVAGKADVGGGFPVVILQAAFTVGSVSVVPAVRAPPPTACAAVLLRVKHALVRSAAAVAFWETGRESRKGEKEQKVK